ncbi:hypothetical protein IFM89_034944 [Coptis chinensis]|uniref:R13L1/DRL21-like LRR repeat region domain-containing protein n=1 Tax=Coptis chinensis TaxID=261450 RepID=A0A835I5R1_9MAGN|nr:hypothetical protein IFM89_034944 [Coptis chinensis]
MEGVLENLEPHKESLERLVIRYYAGFTLPRWMLSVEESVLSNIVDLKLDWCPNLKVLPALGKLQFLERLDLTGLKAVKHLGADLLRVENGASTSSSSVVLFPKLKYLNLYYLSEWKEEEHDVPTTIIIMPRLHTLKIGYCPKLKVEPHYLFPPRLETLELWGDVGVLSKSLIMSLTHNNNLKSLTIKYFPHSSLPQGLNQLTSLQELNFYICKFLDFKPEELKPLTTLCTLEIDFCLIMSIRSREDWSILTHIPNIVIDYINITSNSYSYPGLPAIGGPIGHLLEQNAQVFKQISANFATLQIHDVHKNINLFCQTRDNILTIMNILNDMPGIMKEMPPLPIKLNEELANSILPRPTRPMRS